MADQDDPLAIKAQGERQSDKPMTLQEAAAVAARHGYVLEQNTKTFEFRVAPLGLADDPARQEVLAFYTADITDAVETVWAESRSMNEGNTTLDEQVELTTQLRGKGAAEPTRSGYTMSDTGQLYIASLKEMAKDPSALLYRLDSDGGFTVGQRESGLAGYAYPTSAHAGRAKDDPASVARAMFEHEWGNREFRADGMPAAADCRAADARHMAALEAGLADGSTEAAPRFEPHIETGKALEELVRPDPSRERMEAGRAAMMADRPMRGPAEPILPRIFDDPRQMELPADLRALESRSTSKDRQDAIALGRSLPDRSREEQSRGRW